MRIFVVCLLVLTGLHAEEQGKSKEREVASQTLSVGLFKNGLGIVDRQVVVDGPGTYIVADAPSPVHGTFWITSGDDVVVRVGVREQQIALTDNLLIHRQHLAGRLVTIHIGGQNPGTATGILRSQSDHANEWSRAYEQRRHYGFYYMGDYSSQGQYSGGDSAFIALDTEQGLRLIRSDLVEQMVLKEPLTQVTVRKPVLIFEVRGDSRRINYGFMSKGLSWAPSYRLGLNGNAFEIVQKATIRNEFEDLQNVEFFAISGFPNVPFSHVDSPLAATATWSGFFSQLHQRDDRMHGHAGNRLVTQQVAYNAHPSQSGSTPELPVPAGEQAVDLHFQSLGRMTLARGESLACTVARAGGEHQDIIEWHLPDLRKPDGRMPSDYEQSAHGDRFAGHAWEAVRFTNPFAFPMTTAVMTIYREGTFAGQTMSHFINPQGQATARINRALSIGTTQTEEEVPNSRKNNIVINLSRYTEVTLLGTITIRNNRATAIDVLTRRELSGTVLETSEQPTAQRLLDAGASYVNQRHELQWTFTLNPGEEREITYKYSLLQP